MLCDLSAPKRISLSSSAGVLSCMLSMHRARDCAVLHVLHSRDPMHAAAAAVHVQSVMLQLTSLCCSAAASMTLLLHDKAPQAPDSQLGTWVHS